MFFDLERPRTVTMFPKWYINVSLDYLHRETFSVLDWIEISDLSLWQQPTEWLRSMPFLDRGTACDGILLLQTSDLSCLRAGPSQEQRTNHGRTEEGDHYRWRRMTSPTLCVSSDTTFMFPGRPPPLNSSSLWKAERRRPRHNCCLYGLHVLTEWIYKEALQPFSLGHQQV